MPEAWKEKGQEYCVKGWSTERDGELNCMWRTNGTRRCNGDEEFEDEEGEQLVCSMRGTEWEPLPYPIIVDSGASASTLPKEWCKHVKLWETTESRNGQSFNAANGDVIPNLGRRSVTLMTKEGAVRDMKFEVCSVTRALGSVSQMCRAGHRVVFNPPWNFEGSYIEHIETGQKMWLIERDGIYLLDVRVAPESRQTGNHQDFHGQGP